MGETTQGRTGKWAKRPGAKRFVAKGKVGETTQGRTGKWAKRPGFLSDSRDNSEKVFFSAFLASEIMPTNLDENHLLH